MAKKPTTTPAASAAPAPSPDALESFKNFNPQTTRWSEHNALALAYASDLAYKEEAEIRATLPAWGFNKVEVHTVREVQVYVAISAAAVIVAFRGTRPDQVRDWMTDLDIRQISFHERFGGPDVGGVHAGFTIALLRVWDLILADIQTQQTKAQTLWLTGHSLGGALATLASAALTFAKRMPINGLYTYGQPRVGDITFTGHCDNHLGNVHFRFVNDLDIVTRVPPRMVPKVSAISLILPAASFFFYGHSGQVLYFDAKGILHTDQTWWNQFLLRMPVGNENMDMLSQPIKDHDLLLSYAANVTKYRDDLAGKKREPVKI